jgi:thiol-disulfide isomerase/thioredoxin
MFALTLAAQTVPTVNPYPGSASPASSATELSELRQAIDESNGSPGDLTRALERYLVKYPDSAQRAAIEASLWKGAVDSNDHARIILYGEKLLAGKPNDELETLDHVIRALLVSDDAESARKALVYVKRYLLGIDELRAKPPEGHTTAAQWADFADRALARASVVQARAIGNVGDFEGAAAAAQRSWKAMPTAEAAREIGKWLVKLGRDSDAIEYYADAVVIDDTNASWADRDYDRKTATRLYAKVHGSEEGVGDLYNQAWDRTAAILRDRKAGFKAMDPNYGQTDAFGFVLPAIGSQSSGGAPLDMAKLKNKTLVIDFWATWCAPCVAQHPIIERVKQSFAEKPDVVFISLDTDDDHSLVAPFLKAQKWDQRVYLEAGLAVFYNVTSLPTILVISPSGALYSRVTGVSDNFERILNSRISEARTGAAP